MPFVRCVNARRHQRHKIHSSSQPRFSSRTEWRGALPLLDPRFVHRELPCCAASRAKRWRPHRRDPATQVSRGPRISHKKAETQTQVTFALAIPTRVLHDDPCDTSLHDKICFNGIVQATHTCSFYLFLQWNAPARKEPSSFPLSGFDQHANVCSTIALPMAFIKTGEKCRRTKSCQAHDGAVWCGSTSSEEQDQQIQGAPPTNDTCLRIVLCHTPWCKFKMFTRTAWRCICGNVVHFVRIKVGV